MIRITQQLTTKQGLTFTNGILLPLAVHATRTSKEATEKKVSVSMQVFASQDAYDNDRVPIQSDEVPGTIEFTLAQVNTILNQNKSFLAHVEDIAKKWLTDNNIAFDEI